MTMNEIDDYVFSNMEELRKFVLDFVKFHPGYLEKIGYTGDKKNADEIICYIGKMNLGKTKDLEKIGIKNYE
jgi:hypothetical protein